MIELFMKLKEAYDTTTPKNNRFKKALESINWESTFSADGEFYFVKGNMIFTAQSLDPFAEEYKPSAIFLHGSYVSF